MKAALIHGFDGIEKVVIEEQPIPQPKEDEVQIAVKYAGVNPVDWKVAEGLLKTRMDYQFPLILGWDVSGKIASVGQNVTHFKEGDPVFAYCRKHYMKEGSFADFICLAAKNVVEKPKRLSFAQAAAAPLCCLTAWQSLYETAEIGKDQSVLIHAGSGGVGSFAIQLAKLKGAYVITTTGKANFDYVKNLGADEVIDYTEEKFAEIIQKKFPQGVDIIFDTIGGKTLKSSYPLIKKGGCLVTIVGVVDHALAADHAIKAEFVFVRPNGPQLQEIATLFEEGKLTPPHIQEVPFQEIQLALRKSREGHVQGKLVLKVN